VADDPPPAKVRPARRYEDDDEEDEDDRPRRAAKGKKKGAPVVVIAAVGGGGDADMVTRNQTVLYVTHDGKRVYVIKFSQKDRMPDDETVKTVYESFKFI
jgi:hypothetical protein